MAVALTQTRYHNGTINQDLNLRCTLTEIMISDSSFSILVCKDPTFSCGAGVFQVLLLDIMLPHTLNMPYIDAISLSFTMFAVLPHVADVGEVEVKVRLRHLDISSQFE